MTKCPQCGVRLTKKHTDDRCRENIQAGVLRQQAADLAAVLKERGLTRIETRYNFFSSDIRLYALVEPHQTYFTMTGYGPQAMNQNWVPKWAKTVADLPLQLALRRRIAHACLSDKAFYETRVVPMLPALRSARRLLGPIEHMCSEDFQPVVKATWEGLFGDEKAERE